MVQRIKSDRNKENITISLDADLYDYLASLSGPGRQFSSISHGLERAVALMKGQRDERLDELETRVAALETLVRRHGRGEA